MFAYLARQAIYDENLKVFAYELLFRDGVKNCFPDISPDEATSSMLAGSHLSVGVESITGSVPAFINFHQDTLLYRFPSTLDPLNVVIEIVETVDVTPELIAACKHISDLGYKLALDDYDFGAHWEPLMVYIDYIKLEVEAIELDKPEILEKIQTFRLDGKLLVAEKVETRREFLRLKEAGFHYFQGYFLSRPEMIKHKNIDVSLNSVFELVNISVSSDFDEKKVIAIFEKDVGLAFKLMRFINNPLFNKRQRIDSVKHALKYLGHVELKKFIALLAIANIKSTKPLDLILISLCRAQFCKMLASATRMKEDPPYSFILGLFSLLDALLDMPMEKIMSSLPFSELIKNVLCNEDEHGLLAKQFQLCIAFETADWTRIDVLSKELQIEQSDMFSMYYQSVQWANAMKSTFK
jgi:EAL and modified HD-GYP domain-containing signal transduction protein